MKRVLIGASLVALAGGIATAHSTAPAAHPSAKPVVPLVHILKYKVAPADEYFGKMKLSILGIRNTIKDNGLKVDADPTQGERIVNSCSLAEDAVRDWEAKYPQDTWLPRTIFTLERLYAKLDSDFGRSKAKATMEWLVHDFPKSPQGKIGKTELADNKVGVKPIAENGSDGQPVVGSAPAQKSSP